MSPHDLDDFLLPENQERFPENGTQNEEVETFDDRILLEQIKFLENHVSKWILQKTKK